MNKPVTYRDSPLAALNKQLGAGIKSKTGKFLMRLAIGAILIYLLMNRDISIDIQFSDMLDDSIPARATDDANSPRPVQTSQKVSSGSKGLPQNDNRGNHFSNLPFGGAGKKVVTEAEKRRKMQLYVKKYAKIAQSQMREYGIPASITIAQGLLESDAGESRLAIENNNHFGIKCFSKTCKRGHCTNFTDDSHKDFFRKFDSAVESFKAHSQLLSGERYQFLYRYRKTDYSSWAKGLRRAGYATDPNYHHKLIRLIQEMDLHDYDR